MWNPLAGHTTVINQTAIRCKPLHMEEQNSNAGTPRTPRRTRSFGPGNGEAARPPRTGAPRGNGGPSPRRPGGGRNAGNPAIAVLIRDNKFSAQPSQETPHDPDALRFVPLGGHEEIGRNCAYFEYKNDIVLSDVGLQFGEEKTPGIDFIIPNMSSLAPKKENVRGIILTHGHLDHIGGIHFVMEQLGNPIIYTSQFTKAMVEKRHEEFQNAPKLRFEIVEHGKKVTLGENMQVEFFNIDHTIPDALGFILRTPVGNMVSFGDFRVDTDRNRMPRNIEAFEWLATQNVHTLFLDSTNAEFPGHSKSEEVVEENLEMLIREAKGRVIIGTFASLVDRMLIIMKIADKLGKKVALNGRGMITSAEIAKNQGMMKGRTDHLIPIDEANKYKDHELIILTTGSQGESNAGLNRIAMGEHRTIEFKPTDTVVFSSSTIPGNERSVQNLRDKISYQVDEIYNSEMIDVHASGHARAEDMKLIISLIKPKFVVPIHGYNFKRKAFLKIADAITFERDRVKLVDNGQVCSVTEDTFTVTQEMVDASYVIVDGLGIGDVEEMVLRDRSMLGEEGFLTIIIPVDRHTGRLIKSPDVIARGFIQMREHHGLIEEVKRRVRTTLQRIPENTNFDMDFIKSSVREQVNQFIWVKTKRRPMLLPIVIEL